MANNDPRKNRILAGEALPEKLAAALKEAGLESAGTVAAFPADMSASGRFEDHWLVVCRDRLAVAHNSLPGGAYRVSIQEPFDGLTAIEYRGMVGGGMVLVRRGREQHELVRCSPETSRPIQGALGKLRGHLGLDKAAEPKPEKKEVEKDKEDEKGKDVKKDAPEALAVAELSEDSVRAFREQMKELDVQRYCPKCGLPLKPDSSVCPVCVSHGRTIIRILQVARAHRAKLVVLGLFMLASSLVALAPPYIYGRMFDIVLVPANPGPETARLGWLVGSVAALLLLQGIGVFINILQGRTSVGVAAAVSRDLRGRVFRCLQLQALAYFDRHKTGALMSRVNDDTRQLEGFLVDGVQWTVISALQAVLISAILFCINWRLALLVVLPAPVILIVTRLVWDRVMRRFRGLWEVMSRLSATLNDSLRGVRVVKSFGREEQEIDRFNRRNAACHDALVGAERTWITLAPLLQLIIGAGAYLVWLVAGSSIIFGEMTPGTLVSFIQYLPMLYGPLQFITRLNQWLTRSLTAGERIFEILDSRPEIAEAADAVAMPRIEGRIEMRDVTFGYEKHSPVLKRVNLDLAAGEMVGLVGHSGAGKSTAINLISRLYDVDEGRILIDGVDIRKIRLADLHRQVGVVLQEPFLFSGTISENIAYAKPDATQDEIMTAAKLANAHGFIMSRPDGYDSPVEEGGGNLSGGEKQRLSIARAILHDPRILILDEATSSVDTKTEKAIQEALRRLTEGRTTIAIAHRLSTLSGADRLVVFEKGTVKETGTHKELTEREGIYHELVKAQTDMASLVAIGG